MPTLSDRDRGSSTQRGYDRQWEKAAKKYKREHPLCVGCLAVGRVEPTTVIDHIEPHRGDQHKFWDQANWQACCKWHHDQVKSILELKWERGDIERADLRLDSRVAIELTKKLGTTVGVDGWLTL